MQKPLFRRVAILGLGLIGSSLARALAEGKLAEHIAAFDTSYEALQEGIRGKFIHSHHGHAGQAAEHSDVIILAVPPHALAALARDIAPFIKAGALITDVTSVKRLPVEVVTAALPEGTSFIPGHPIAGSQKTGAAEGRGNLFAGKRVILTPKEQDVMGEPVKRIRELWESTGAKVEYMPAELHDHIYAYVSHLPQIVAFASAKTLKGFKIRDEAFLRFTRLGQSDRALWADICISNIDYINEALSDFITFAAQMAGELSESENGSAETENEDTATLLFPKIISTCLIASASLLQERSAVHPAHYAGTGFTDMTFAAIDDPEAALAAISAHHKTVTVMLKSTLERLHHIRDAIRGKDQTKLAALFLS